MSSLDRIAYALGCRDEVPNQELAKELAGNHDTLGIRTIAENLWNKNSAIQSDCLKVLYEIGYLDPSLITAYHEEFLRLLKSKNNRLVWGAMIALSTIAPYTADALFGAVEQIKEAIAGGSVITIDNGIKTLAALAAANPAYCLELYPYLLNHLKTCRPKDVPHHAEYILVAADKENQGEFVKTLESRFPEISESGIKRLKRVIHHCEKV